MNRYAIPILAIFTLALLPASLAFSGAGSGTAGDPFIITNTSQFNEMRDNLTAYYELGNDIDMAGATWDGPVGNWDTAYFQGSFDGNNYTISNFHWTHYDSTYGNPGGIWGALDMPAEGYIKNLFLTNYSLIALNNATGETCCWGSVIGTDDSTNPWEMSNIHVTDGFFEGTYVTEDGGGMVGYFSGNNERMYNLSWKGDVYLGGSSGALIGYITGEEIGEYLSFEGNVHHRGRTTSLYSPGNVVGGLIGTMHTNGSLKNSYSIANISFTNTSGCDVLSSIDACAAAGLIGYIATIAVGGEYVPSTISIENSYFYGTLPENGSGVNNTVFSSPDVAKKAIGAGSINITCTNTYYRLDAATSLDDAECDTGITGLNDDQFDNKFALTGFNFTTVWAIDALSTPKFQWQNTSDLGTEYNPYEISTVSDWNAIQARIDAGEYGGSFSGPPRNFHYELMNDLDIGTNTLDTSVGAVWGLILDGNNYTLTVSGSTGILGDYLASSTPTSGRNQLELRNMVIDGTLSSVGLNGGMVAGFTSPSTMDIVLENLKFTGSIAETGTQSEMGSIYGQHISSSSTSVIRNVYSDVSLTSAGDAGGLISNARSISIEDSYYYGVLDATNNAGGLVEDGCCGLSATTSYFDSDVANTTTSFVGTAKTTTELKNISTYSGWDISTGDNVTYTWGIDSYTNNGYAFLTRLENLGLFVNSTSPANNTEFNETTAPNYIAEFGFDVRGGSNTYQCELNIDGSVVMNESISMENTSSPVPVTYNVNISQYGKNTVEWFVTCYAGDESASTETFQFTGRENFLIDSCRAVTEAGTYTQTQNVTGAISTESFPACLSVESSNIVLELGNYEVDSVGGRSIILQSGNSNITINGGVTDDDVELRGSNTDVVFNKTQVSELGRAISLQNNNHENIIFDNVTLSASTGDALQIYGNVNNVTVTNSQLTAANKAIDISGTNNGLLVLKNNVLQGNSQDAVIANGLMNVEENTFIGGSFGLYISNSANAEIVNNNFTSTNDLKANSPTNVRVIGNSFASSGFMVDFDASVTGVFAKNIFNGTGSIDVTSNVSLNSTVEEISLSHESPSPKRDGANYGRTSTFEVTRDTVIVEVKNIQNVAGYPLRIRIYETSDLQNLVSTTITDDEDDSAFPSCCAYGYTSVTDVNIPVSTGNYMVVDYQGTTGGVEQTSDINSDMLTLVSTGGNSICENVYQSSTHTVCGIAMDIKTSDDVDKGNTYTNPSSNGYSDSCLTEDGEICYEPYTNNGATDYFTVALSSPTPQGIFGITCPSTLPNEQNLPSPAQFEVTFDVFNFEGYTSPTVDNLLKGTGVSATGDEADCSYVANSGLNRTYTCNVSMNYWFPAENYDVNITFAEGSNEYAVEQANTCTYGQLLASQRTVNTISFPDAAPGVSDSLSANPVVVKNTGNVEFDVDLTAYDLVGRSSPSITLPASAFKAGESLGVAQQLADSTQTNLSITVAPAQDAQEEIFFWLSMPVDQAIQDYYAPDAWSVVVS